MDIGTERCGDCAWYHGTWPTWRALGLGSTPRWHAHFYREAAAGVPSGARVLITGAADAEMVDVVAAAFDRPEITVLDRCPTPLARVGDRAETVAVDVLEYRAPPFDAICTHAFLGYFPPAERPRLAAAWHRLLRPGGRLMTVNRLREETGLVRFRPAEAEAFVASVRAGAAAIGEDPDRLAALARRYTGRFASWPVRAGEIPPLLSAFASVEVRHEARTRPGPGGPAAPGDAVYALVRATR